MTKTFTLVIVPASFRRSPTGQVSGIVFVEIGPLAFPNREWSDSVVAMLGMWSQQFITLLNGTAREVDLPFMDGPFVVRLSSRASNRIQVDLINRAHAESVEGNLVLPVREIAAAISGVIQRTLQACSSNLWWSPDIDALNSGLEELLAFRGV
jgi:hypothetical protein